MNLNEILNVVLVVLTLISTAVGYYFKAKEKLTKEINKFINDAEDGVSVGSEKMEKVVNELYLLVPVPYRGILNKNVIEKMVQLAFDKIEEYAKKQVNKEKKDR